MITKANALFRWFSKKPVVWLGALVISSFFFFLICTKIIFTAWESKLQHATEANPRLQALHRIIYLLSDIETDARKFSLTNDQINLVHYNDHTRRLQSSLKEIKESYSDGSISSITDSLEQSVNSKIQLFNAFLKQTNRSQLKDDLSQELETTAELMQKEQLNTGKQRTESKPEKIEPKEVQKQEKKKFKLEDLFKRKKQKNVVIEKKDAPVEIKNEPQPKLPDYDSLLQALEKKQQYLVEQQSIQELIWLQQDASLTSRIISYLRVLEQEELINNEQETIASKGLVKNIFRSMVYFLSVILTISTLLTILPYLKKKQ